ncbi:MurR/RpiR family transcriptional regulator [Denitrobaculum tricleocarpae]|nr:MurR/RpiR family transcriptional regulator [Denitrobaculum tricleocarpae]
MHTRLDAAFERLGPRLKIAARYVLDHPDDVALYSMRTLAERAGVAPATLSRLARAIQCEDYETFRHSYRAMVAGRHDPGASFAGRARALKADAGNRKEAMREQAEAVVGNIDNFLASGYRESLDLAADILISARSVQVVGMMSGFSLAIYAHYVASMAFPNWSLLRTQGGSIANSLYDLSEEDAVIAFSSEPYSRATMVACQDARAAGVKVVAMTDRRSAPLARIADVALVAPADSPHYFPSIAAQVTVIEGLLSTMLKRAGSETLTKIETIEAARHAYGEYWDEEKEASSARS